MTSLLEPASRRILVTGANGFVGRSLSESLSLHHNVLGGLRSQISALRLPRQVTGVVLGDLSEGSYGPDLHGAEIVIHTAGLAHVLDPSRRKTAAFEEVNARGTASLARAAVRQGVRRLVFISSIGVNGPATRGRAFTEADDPGPQTPYAVSKARAEQSLWEVARETSLEVVVVRPPLVYGPGAGGNFARLTSLVRRGLPLPFASIQNERSLISLGNLIHAVEAIALHPNAAGELFLVADSERVSTPQLIRLIAIAMGRTPRLVPAPVMAMEAMARVLGRASEIRQLTRSLAVSTEKISRIIGWTPPFSLPAGIRAALLPT